MEGLFQCLRSKEVIHSYPQASQVGGLRTNHLKHSLQSKNRWLNLYSPLHFKSYQRCSLLYGMTNTASAENILCTTHPPPVDGSRWGRVFEVGHSPSPQTSPAKSCMGLLWEETVVGERWPHIWPCGRQVGTVGQVDTGRSPAQTDCCCLSCLGQLLQIAGSSTDTEELEKGGKYCTLAKHLDD